MKIDPDKSVMIKKRADILAILFLGGSCLLFLSFQLGSWFNFLYRPGSEISDLTITFWPNAYFIKQTIIENHQYPFWRPMIFSGAPIDGDPQSGLFYIPNILLLIFPITLGFNILFWFHIVLGGIGSWFLSRSLGISRSGSLLAAVVFAYSPKTFAHLGFGHVGIFYSTAYIPWIYWSLRLVLLNKRKYLYLFAVLWGMQILVNPQIALYTGLVCWCYASIKAIQRYRESRKLLTVIKSSAKLGYASILAVLIASVLIFPMLKLAMMSGRQGLSLEDTAISSIPYRYLLGLILADHNGYMEYMLYIGVAPLVFAFFALKTRIGRLGWLGVIFGLLFAIGSNSSFYQMVYRLLPPLGWLRSPGRFWFVELPIIAVLAGLGFDRVMMGFNAIVIRGLNLSLMAVASFGIVLLAGIYFMGGSLQLNLIMFSLMSIATLLIIVLMASRRINQAKALELLLGVVLLDLWVMNGTLIEGRKDAEVLMPPDFVEYLIENKASEPWRVYSPSYSIARQIGVVNDLESVDGVDPLYLAEYDQFLQIASGVTRGKYDVTIPAMEGESGEELLMVNRNAVPDPELLGILNVRYVAARYPLETKGLEEVGRYGNTYLYENNKYLTRVYGVSELLQVNSLDEAIDTLQTIDSCNCATIEGNPTTTQFKTDALSVDWMRYSPNSMVFSVTSQEVAYLVISLIFYPDWKAFIDGHPVELFKTNGVVSGLFIEPGKHIVRLDYRPVNTYIGLIISISTFFVCGIGLWCDAKNNKNHGF